MTNTYLPYAELERLNLECQGELSRECNLDAVAARNVLKVALASKVALEGAIPDDECDPYSDMYEMHDECGESYMHQMPTTTGTKLDHIVECAEGRQCDVEEMTQMIEGKNTLLWSPSRTDQNYPLSCNVITNQMSLSVRYSSLPELERLNKECEGTLSRECNLDAVEARNLLKVALASQVVMEEVKSQKRGF